MASSGSATFNDPSEYQASVIGARLSLVLTAPGDFRADLAWAQLRHMTIVRCRENLPRIGYVEAAPGTILLSFKASHESGDVWGGAALEPGEAFVLGAESRVHHRTAGPGRWAWLAVSQERLIGHGRALFQTSLDLPSTFVIVHPAPGELTQLLRLVAQACRLSMSTRFVTAHDEAIRALELHVLDAAVHCLATGTRRNARWRQAGLVADFEDALGRCGEDMRMPVVAGLLGTTQRALRSACAECLGMPPNEYNRLRRFNRVRSALLHAEEGAAVSEIAAAFGFSELGRFAGEYREAFGESPSFTLRKAGARIRGS